MTEHNPRQNTSWLKVIAIIMVIAAFFTQVIKRTSSRQTLTETPIEETTAVVEDIIDTTLPPHATNSDASHTLLQQHEEYLASQSEQATAQRHNYSQAIYLPRHYYEAESPDEAYDEGYDNGYEQGRYDGENGEEHGNGFDDSCDYDGELEEQYIEGYDDGYNAGYEEAREEYENSHSR
ncbi:MAG: hypothetical protein IKR25_12665 [Muribaculaceae bacterium]|nr:hypothetical protein [Muribaculaceae bacterium]